MRAAASMRVCCVVLAALALRCCAEPAREWRELQARPLQELFEPAQDRFASAQDRFEPTQDRFAPAQSRAHAPHKERRRNAKRTPRLPSELASQMMLRAARSGRPYDVPQIECPPAADGMERFACPTPDRQGRYRCIDDHVLCDGFIDCPNGEDEDRQACMFYKTTKAHLDVLADALLRWARGR
ncbi:uncharacterized protein LOC121733731 [Aricia agestis]|uniref:uncharacterized protein LOC121733731 n=1 Tax=Aricia agestis TaxID=91739 RepID=UPI001C2053F5|nr:uncharacterized protein LOC121733731 [Aricia agestis]